MAKKYEKDKIAKLNATVIAIQKNTGEITDLGYAELKADKQKHSKGFTMIWAERLQNALPDTWLKTKLLMFLIQSARENKVIIYDRELAKKIGCSRQTIQTLKHELQNANIIRCRVGSLMLNPRLVWKGTYNASINAWMEYLYFTEEIERNTKNTQPAGGPRNARISPETEQ